MKDRRRISEDAITEIDAAANACTLRAGELKGSRHRDTRAVLERAAEQLRAAVPVLRDNAQEMASLEAMKKALSDQLDAIEQRKKETENAGSDEG